MSLDHKSIVIKCDGCGDNPRVAGMDLIYHSRIVAKREGWTTKRINKKLVDLCSMCRKSNPDNWVNPQ